jgi:2-phosphosulfolactate phosphatase
MQKIDVVNTVSELSETLVFGKTAVVIDVLRATSVMVTALSYGAKKVVPVLSIEEAFAYRQENPEEHVLLAGERNADPIDGFDLGNSPVDLVKEQLEGSILVMTTTNGTKTIRKAVGAKDLYIASFLNAGATVEALSGCNDVVLIASGTNGEYSLEDVLCAGYMVALLKERGKEILFSDAAWSALSLYENNVNNFPGIAVQGKHYNILKQKGREKDLEFCFRSDYFNLVCIRKNGFVEKVNPVK